MPLWTCTIDGDRLDFELAELGKIGQGDDGGYYRVAFSQADMDGRIFTANAGIASFDMILPLMIDAINRDVVSYGKAAVMLSEKSADVFTLGEKGHLKPGFDVDFVLVNMQGEFVFDMKKSYTPTRESDLMKQRRNSES